MKKSDMSGLFGYLYKHCYYNSHNKISHARLLKFPHITNSNGETLLHHYIRCGGTDKKFIEKMIKHGHILNNVNKSGNSPVQSIICNNVPQNSKYKRKNILWLISKKCCLGSNKVECTEKLLVTTLTYRKGNSVIFNKEYFEYIKKLYDYGVFITNLAEYDSVEHKNLKYFNPAFYTDDLEIIKWFDEHFNINWNLIKINSMFGSHYKNPLENILKLNIVGYHREKINYETAKWVINKGPMYLCINQHVSILGNILRLCQDNSLEIIKFLESFNLALPYDVSDCQGGDDCDKDRSHYFKVEWDDFVGCLESIHNTITINHKLIYIYGVLNGKIDTLSLGIIRRFCLELDDFKKFDSFDHSKMLESINIHYLTMCSDAGYKKHILCLFPEDPNQGRKDYERLKDSNMSIKTKNECKDIKNKIIKYLKTLKIEIQ